MDQAHVKELPECDICKRNGQNAKAEYDTKTVIGRWAFLCRKHYLMYGVKPTTKLIKIKPRKPKRKFDKPPIVTVPLTLDSVSTVKCPSCGQPRKVEPDANYSVGCEACGEKYRVASLI